jgi:hypothetical protein
MRYCIIPERLTASWFVECVAATVAAISREFNMKDLMMKQCLCKEQKINKKLAGATKKPERRTVTNVVWNYKAVERRETEEFACLYTISWRRVFGI